MPRLQPIQTNFTAGELSPLVRGRVDLQQYANGAQLIENAYPVIQGGVFSRPGTTYRAQIKSNARARLVPFVRNRSTAYVQEWGAGYMRLFKDGAAVGAPDELATPYTYNQVKAMDYAADADTAYLAHPDVYPQRLRRFADDRWQIAACPFTAEPFSEVGTRPTANLTLSLKTVGAGRTATASAPTFLAADVGRAILSGPGIGVVTAYTDSTHVTIEITAEFDSTAVTSQTWTLDASPQTGCLPSAFEPVGASITLTLDDDGWRASEADGFVRINGGLCRITGIVSAKVANATIVKDLAAATKAPKLAWAVLTDQWSVATGYPRTVSLHQQRLIYASSTEYPQTVWGSRIAEPLDFTLGTDDDLAYSFTISSDDNNEITWLATARDLMALSAGCEYSLRGGVEKPITPTNVTITPQTDHGSAAVRPVQVRRETVFVQGAGKKLRGLSYRYDIDGYDAPDLLALAAHLVERDEDTGEQLSIVDLCYQREPHGLLWAVRSDGKLLSCTLDRAQSVVAWARHDVGGQVESICCVPSGASDVVYMIVKRTVDGSARRFLESIDMTTSSTRLSEVNGMQLDCGVMLYDADGSTTWTHPQLVNTLVQVLADGNYMGEFTTNGAGQITLPRVAYSVQIGLPFRSAVLPVTPEVGTGTGTSSGQAMATADVTLRIASTGPMWCNGQEFPGREFGVEVLDKPQPLTTGLVNVSEWGWEKGTSDLLIERRLPFPMKLLNIIRTMTINQG